MRVSPETDPLLARADALREVGRGDEALALVAQVLAVGPSNAAAHGVAARVHISADRARPAWDHIVAMLRTDPDDPVAHFLLALVEADLGRRAVALQEADQVCRLAPHSHLGHLAAAAASLNVASLAPQARRAAYAALERNPQDPDMHVWVARAHMYNGRARVPPGDRAIARAALDEALRLEPRHAEALSERATLDAMGFSWRSALRGHAGVLADDPHAQESMGAIAYTFGRMIFWAHWVVWACWLAAIIGSMPDADGVHWPARVAAAVALVVTGGTLVMIHRALGRTFWAHVRAFPRRDPLGVAWFGLLLVLTALIVAAGLLPGEAGLGMLGIGKVVIWAAVIVSWIRRARS